MAKNLDDGNKFQSSSVDVDYPAVFSALTTPRARYLFAYLHERDTPVALEDVARDLAVWECDSEPSEISEETEQRILRSLYHAKAPKLDGAGLIDFDSDERTVGLSDTGAHFDDLAYLPQIEPA